MTVWGNSVFLYSNCTKIIRFCHHIYLFAALLLRHWVIDGSCGNYGSFLAWGWPRMSLSGLSVCVCVCACGAGGGGEGLWAVSKVDNSARAPHLPRFILLKSFSDTLLVVSILDRVFDCHL